MGGAVTGFAKSYKRGASGRAGQGGRPAASSRKTARAAELLIDETLRDPGCVEVGHVDGLRWGVGLVERPFPPQGEPAPDALTLGPDSVVLVTGAAGSIVSAITADLATASGGDLPPARPHARRRIRPTRTCAATSRTATGSRPTSSRGCGTAGSGRPRSPIEKELAGFERLAAALAAIEAVEAAGGTAHYHCVDLTDADAVERVLDDGARAISGRVDVLLHAAGLEISRGLPDKEPAEFDLVFDVKADGWFNLLHGAGDLPIGATVVFSLGGRPVRQRRADRLQRRQRPAVQGHQQLPADPPGHPGARPRLDGVGRHRHGDPRLDPEDHGDWPASRCCPPEAGVAWIRRELTAHAFRGEVVVAGALGADGRRAPPDRRAGPGRARRRRCRPDGRRGRQGRASTTGWSCRPTLDPAAQPFLDHHRIDGTPVLPGSDGDGGVRRGGPAAGARLARRRGRGRRLPGAGEVLPGRAADAHGHRAAAARRRGPARRVPAHGGAGCCPASDEPAADGALHRRGAAARRSRRAAETTEPAGRRWRTRRLVAREDVYRLYFHGPAYQVVDEAWRDDGDGGRPGSPTACPPTTIRRIADASLAPAAGGAVLPDRRAVGGRPDRAARRCPPHVDAGPAGRLRHPTRRPDGVYAVARAVPATARRSTAPCSTATDG